MQLTGSQVVMECLKEQSVEYIFGYPGGAIMPVYDALYDYRDEIKHILTSHEQGAVHAADGYARVTGKVGVCFCTSGPGATNTVTGIATAYMDSIPLVVISGQVALSLIGKDSFQEVDVTGVTLPVTKHNCFINSIDELADTIREAFYIAQEGRPGPVLIDLPKNIMFEKVEFESQIPQKYTANNDIDSKKIQEIANLINEAKKPIIYAGGGIIISGASEELCELANKAEIPVTNSLMGLGSYPREERLSLGMVGMHGSKEANLATNRSDLIIAIGARFSDRVIGNAAKFAPRAKIIHMDMDPSEIGKNIKTHCSIIGDVKAILTQLLPLIEKKDRKDWIETIEAWVRPEVSKDKFVAKNIFRVADEVLGEDTLIVTEVGQHQMWTAQSWPFKKPRTFITSGGLGTMGYGLGAAIGSQIAAPNRNVIHIAGDGSFRMNLNELATVAVNKLPIITLVMKNDTLGMVRQWQKLFHNERYSSTDLPDVIDYIKLADAFGIKGVHVRNLNELKEAIEEAHKERRARLIVCHLDINDGVYPIVPPSESIDNQIFK